MAPRPKAAREERGARFRSLDAKHKAIEEGRRDVAEGRVVPHAEVVRWIKSLGTDKKLPKPRAKAKSAR